MRRENLSVGLGKERWYKRGGEKERLGQDPLPPSPRPSKQHRLKAMSIADLTVGALSEPPRSNHAIYAQCVPCEYMLVSVRDGSCADGVTALVVGHLTVRPGQM